MSRESRLARSMPTVIMKRTKRCTFCEKTDENVLTWDDARGEILAHLECMQPHSHACPPGPHRCVLRFQPRH